MWILIFLIGCACLDLKMKSLPVWLLMTASVSLGIYRVCNWEESGALWLGGAGIGILFLIISRLTDEAIGYGDSWMILLLGIYLGLWDILWLLSIAFVLSGMTSVVLLVRNRYSRKLSFPFIPFLALSYAGVMYL